MYLTLIAGKVKHFKKMRKSVMLEQKYFFSFIGQHKQSLSQN